MSQGFPPSHRYLPVSLLAPRLNPDGYETQLRDSQVNSRVQKLREWHSISPKKPVKEQWGRCLVLRCKEPLVPVNRLQALESGGQYRKTLNESDERENLPF